MFKNEESGSSPEQSNFEQFTKGTVAFTVRVDREVFAYLFNLVKKGRFSDISKAVDTLLKEAIRRRSEE